MINKQNLWFLTLFSLILILGVYYVTLPNDFLKNIEEQTTKKVKKEKAVVEEINESPLVAMRVNLQEERQEEMNVLQEKLTNEKLTSEEKNNLYEELKYLNEVQGKEEKIEEQIKKETKLDCFIQIDNNNISAVCVSKEHDATLANDIMRLIQKNYENKKNITIKFKKE